jgi:4'-phosphopantetheinyl transferase
VRTPAAALPPAGTAACWKIAVGGIDAAAHEALFALLSAEERARAGRFRRTEDQRSFTAAHGALRLLLGVMLGEKPRSFSFAANAHGKPCLVPHRAIEFNMSHSGGIVLIALARHIPVGVDVEALRPMAERATIVRRYFHPGEVADFARVSPAAAEAAFFRCWSRKEAVVKALGLGMSLDLNRYRVACLPGAEAQVLALEGEDAPQRNWSLIDLDVGPGHVGALAARHRPFIVNRAEFDAATVRL